MWRFCSKQLQNRFEHHTHCMAAPSMVAATDESPNQGVNKDAPAHMTINCPSVFCVYSRVFAVAPGPASTRPICRSSLEKSKFDVGPRPPRS